MPISRTLRALPALAVALCAGPVIAQSWFAVEVIVFEHRDDASHSDEQWPRDPGVPDLSAAVELQAPTRPPTLQPFEQLAPDARQMGGALRTLERSSRYRPLVHVAWMQPGLGPDDAVALRVDLDSGRLLPAEPLVIEPPVIEPLVDDLAADEDDAWFDDPLAEDEPPVDRLADDFEFPLFEITNPWLLAELLRNAYAEPPVPERLQGTLTLVLQRFLHLETDLLLTTDEALPPEEGREWYEARETILADLVYGQIGADEARARLAELAAEPRFQAYRLQERRRLRTGEVHYFDHPKVGVVATVRRVPQEEVDARIDAYERARDEAERITAPATAPPSP